MASVEEFPLVRGKKMRVTSLDGCYGYYGQGAPAPDGFVSEVNVSSSWVSIASTVNVNEGEEISVVNANGQTCVKDSACPELSNYTLEITFCKVSPCLFAMLTGQEVILDGLGQPIGFSINSKVSVCGTAGFALEVWLGSPGAACVPGAQGSYGYILYPAVRPGVLGDFTIENAAITFTIQNCVTQDGNVWGVGPSTYLPLNDVTGTPRQISTRDANDHVVVLKTTVPPPDDTDGCVPLDHTVVAATSAITGAPGTWVPLHSKPPLNAADANTKTIAAQPTTLWAQGEYVQGSTAGSTGEMFWDGTKWKVGRARVNATGATAGTPGTFTPSGSIIPSNATEAGNWSVTATPNTAWTTGQYVQGSTPGITGQMHWDGTAWVGGQAVVLTATGTKGAK